MKITYANLLLCEEPEAPKNFSISLRKRVQSEDIINSFRPIVSDRGNEKYTVSFALEKAHKNPAEAEKALFELLRTLSDASPAVLEISFGDPSKGGSMKFENSVLSKCAAAADGRITTHSLEFSTGRKESL